MEHMLVIVLQISAILLTLFLSVFILAIVLLFGIFLFFLFKKIAIKLADKVFNYF